MTLSYQNSASFPEGRDRDPFPDNFLKAVAALVALDGALVQIGLGGSREFAALGRVILEHGAETHRISGEAES